jgi:hypothetical protein
MKFDTVRQGIIAIILSCYSDTTLGLRYRRSKNDLVGSPRLCKYYLFYRVDFSSKHYEGYFGYELFVLKKVFFSQYFCVISTSDAHR